MVIEARDIEVTFTVRAGSGRRHRLVALRDIDLDVGDGEAVGIVGESGSGKSTLGRALLRLVRCTKGSISLNGTDITHLKDRDLRPLRRQMQMVFQDPYSSLDPSSTINEVVGEPLAVHTQLNRRERNAAVRTLLEQVGLNASHAARYPYEFSGGQRQRIAIARAIALHPELVVLDEAVSALDVSTQNQILRLLDDLRRDLGLAYLFISHDISAVRHLTETCAVMYLGRIIESGPTDRVCSTPAHPYTVSLLSAVPIADPIEQRQRTRIVLSGDAPDPLAPPSGCPFRTRCQHEMPICAQEMPGPTPVAGGGWVACHLHSPGDLGTTATAVAMGPTVQPGVEEIPGAPGGAPIHVAGWRGSAARHS